MIGLKAHPREVARYAPKYLRYHHGPQRKPQGPHAVRAYAYARKYQRPGKQGLHAHQRAYERVL